MHIELHFYHHDMIIQHGRFYSIKEDIMCSTNPSMSEHQRPTTTKSSSESHQMKFPPAPLAMKDVDGMAGYMMPLSPGKFSHHINP